MLMEHQLSSRFGDLKKLFQGDPLVPAQVFGKVVETHGESRKHLSQVDVSSSLSTVNTQSSAEL